MENCNPNYTSGNKHLALYSLQQQIPPSPLPEFIPGNIITFNFENESCAISIFDGLNCEDKSTTVDEALNIINEYFCCFPQELCSASDGDILQFNGNVNKYEIKPISTALLNALNLIIGVDEYLTNLGGGITSVKFCESTAKCVRDFLINDDHVLTLDGGVLVSRSLNDLIGDYLSRLLPPGHILIGGAGGDVLVRELCNEVCKCLVLPAGNFWFGGETGGLFQTPFCPEVMKCLDEQIKQEGDFFIGGPGGVLEVRQFDDEVFATIDEVLGNNQILLGQPAGVIATSFCNAVTTTNCLNPGQFWYNNGQGTGLFNFCVQVMGCLADQLGANEIFFGNDATPTNLCSAMIIAQCFAANPGDIYIHDGTDIPTGYGLLGYLNTYHNESRFAFKDCTDNPTALAYNPDLASWDYIPMLPPTPSDTDKSQYSPPSLRTDKAKMVIEYTQESDGKRCPGWVCSPRQRDFSILVPGDFGSLAEAVEWLDGKTINNLAIDVTQNEPRQIINGFNGRLFLNMNGNSLGGIAIESTTTEVTLANANVVGGVTATNGATLFIDENVTSTSHPGDGFVANLGGRIVFFGDAVATGNGNAGIRARNGGEILVRGNAISNSNKVGFLANTGGTIKVIGKITSIGNAENGIVSAENSVLVADGDIETQNNGFSGMVAGNHSSIKGFNLFANGNGRVGVYARVNSTVTAFIDINCSDNNEQGVLANEGSQISADGTINSSSNSLENILVEEHSAINAFGSVISNASDIVGIRVTTHSTLYGELGVISTNNGANGIVLNFNSNLTTANVITSTNNQGSGLIVAVSSSALAQDGGTLSENGEYGARIFNNSDLTMFNATITTNTFGGVETVSNSTTTLYTSSVVGNAGLDMEARESGYNRVFNPYGSVVGTFIPAATNTPGNFSSYTI